MTAQTCALKKPAGHVVRDDPKPLRFAVIYRDVDLAPWQQRSVGLVERSGYGRLVGCIRVTTAQGAISQLDKDAAGVNLKVVSCRGEKSERGFWQLDHDGVAVVRAMNLDALLVFGIERLDASVTEAARYGAWCFAGFGDRPDAAIVASPVRKGEPLTRIALIKMGLSADDAVILKHAILRTRQTIQENFDHAVDVMSEWPASVAKMLTCGCELPVEHASIAAFNDAQGLSPGQSTKGAVSELLRWLRSKIGSLFTFDQWHIGLAHRSFQEVLEGGLPDDISWAPTPRWGVFYADPMGIEVADGLKVLCERYDHWIGKGDICAFDYSASKGWSKKAVDAIDEPFHLSYPYVLQTGDLKVCLPESCEAGAAFAYSIKADGAISSTEKKQFLNFEIADPTLIKHEGLWYLFGAEAREAQHALRIWYSDSVEGPWTPHPANPVKCDVQTARPAGPIVRLNGKLYRPSQDSTYSYGSACNIMEVVELSPTSFNEVCARKIEPNPRWSYPEGIHTLTTTRDGILIDAKAVRITPLAPLLRIANFIAVRWRRRRLAAYRSSLSSS
ncbi:MAG: hypothetical protein AB7S74_17015 [Hyphomicrobium sp.]